MKDEGGRLKREYRSPSKTGVSDMASDVIQDVRGNGGAAAGSGRLDGVRAARIPRRS